MNMMRDYPIRTLIVFGVLLRIIVLFFYQNISIFPDSQGYLDLSELLLNFNLSGYDGTRSPGYPLLLSFAGGTLWIAVFFQLLIGIASMVVLYKILLLLKFKVKSALFATLLMNSFLHVVFYEIAILTESLTLFVFLLIFMVLLHDYFEKKAVGTDLKMGFLLAFLVLIKPFYIFVPFIIYGFYILKKKPFLLFFSQKIILLLFPIIVFLGWSAVNRINTGYFVPTTFYGFNIAQNCVSFAEKSPGKYKDIAAIYVKNREKMKANEEDIAMAIWSSYPELKTHTKLSFPDLSALLNEFSWATIRKNPSDYRKQVFVSWSDFWRTAIYWNLDEFTNKQSGLVFETIWHIQHYFLKLFKLLFLANVVLLLIDFIRNKKWTIEIIITSIIIAASILQAFTTYGSNSRFSYPLEFLMIIVVLVQLKKMVFNRHL